MVAIQEVDISLGAAVSTPQSQLAELESRLARGYDMIDDHNAAGLPVARLEEHWLSLLAEYELLFDLLDSNLT